VLLARKLLPSIRPEVLTSDLAVSNRRSNILPRRMADSDASGTGSGCTLSANRCRAACRDARSAATTSVCRRPVPSLSEKAVPTSVLVTSRGCRPGRLPEDGTGPVRAVIHPRTTKAPPSHRRSSPPECRGTSWVGWVRGRRRWSGDARLGCLRRP
jgi:hypothetical protein